MVALGRQECFIKAGPQGAPPRSRPRPGPGERISPGRSSHIQRFGWSVSAAELSGIEFRYMNKKHHDPADALKAQGIGTVRLSGWLTTRVTGIEAPGTSWR